jgi:hypothetical protein
MLFEGLIGKKWKNRLKLVIIAQIKRPRIKMEKMTKFGSSIRLVGGLIEENILN